MDPNGATALPLSSVPQSQTAYSGRRSLPPTFIGPPHAFPSYPSSTLQYYFPPSQHVANYAHMHPSLHTDSSQHPETGNFAHMPLPSASQSHPPSLRCSPSFHSSDNINVQNVPVSPLFNRSINTPSRSYHRIHSLSPIVELFTSASHL